MAIDVKRLAELTNIIADAQQEMQWGGWQTRYYEGVTAVIPKQLLVITLRRFYVGEHGKHNALLKDYRGPLIPCPYRDLDPKVHWHVYQLTVDDPAYRWNSRKVCDVYITPNDTELFAQIGLVFTQATQKANYPLKVTCDPLGACVKHLQSL
ncbi:MAG: hypothetical protein WCV85_05050 [Patescibacteria group bacterium]|jgi:hypothetical protein